MKVLREEIDWSYIERRVKVVFRQYAADEVSSFRALRLIDEIFAAGTLRGTTLPPDNIPFSEGRNLTEGKADRVVGEIQEEIWRSCKTLRGVRR